MTELVSNMTAWATTNLLTAGVLWQIAWISVALVAGFALSRRPIRALEAWAGGKGVPKWLAPFSHAICDTLFPAFSLLLFALYAPVAARMELDAGVTGAAVTLGLAWIVIRFFSALVKRPRLARTLAAAVWSVAALHLTGLLPYLIEGMDALAVTVGEARISLLTVLTAFGMLALFLSLATMLSRFAERQLGGVSGLSPSLQVLLGKLTRITLITLAVLVGLNTVGVDLTALTVFGGAVGVGVGFGLQKIISNFISGIILLADRSIKPGDVISVGDTYGWVKHLSTRYVSLVTRDGKEHLIPNELLITERVENWSYSDNNVRMRIPVGVSYDADLRRALELMKEAAAECPRALSSPRANALVTGFGDSSVDLELRMWINDPVEGMGNVRSDVLLRVWDKFREHGIEIPFPQRDIHIKSGHIVDASDRT